MTTIFGKSSKGAPRRRSKLESTTLSGFGGGLNAIDDDLSMRAEFLKELKNFHRTSSGSQKLRFGTGYFADIFNVQSNELREDLGTELREDGSAELRESTDQLTIDNAQILDATYFNGRGIIVTTAGYVVTVADTGSVEVIWSPAICALLPGSPGFWSNNLSLVTFVPFKNTLAIHNGVDKPIVISNLFAVTYLADAGTGSNANTPIGKYGCVAGNYHCVSGFPNSPTEIIISSKGTSGVFPLDPAPNDSISVDVGAYAPEGAAEIRGIAGYRSYLIVFLQNITLQVQLGVYDSNGNHTPTFPDNFPNFGLIGSRCISKVETDLMFAGVRGMANASRSLYVNTQLDSSTVSNYIEPLYQSAINGLTDTQKRLSTFTVYDPLSHDVILFTPGGNTFTYTNNIKMRYKAWSQFQGMDWTCGFTSELGRVFLCKGTKIFQLGNETFGDKYYADRVNDRDVIWTVSTQFTSGQLVWDRVDEQTYICNVTHTSRSSGIFSTDRQANPSFWTKYDGIAIEFELETPWFDGRDPMKVKKLAFISMATKGTAEFTFEAYVDNLYKDYDGNVIHDPAVSMDFIGNDAPGFGVELLDGPFGTGRKSRDPRLFEFPVKFKTIKFRLHGSTKKPLDVMKFSYLFSRGSYFR